MSIHLYTCLRCSDTVSSAGSWPRPISLSAELIGHCRLHPQRCHLSSRHSCLTQHRSLLDSVLSFSSLYFISDVLTLYFGPLFDCLLFVWCVGTRDLRGMDFLVPLLFDSVLLSQTYVTFSRSQSQHSCFVPLPPVNAHR